MSRLFAAVALPSLLRSSLSFLRSGVEGARWIDPNELHLTLRFIGEVDGGLEDDIRSALAMVEAPGFVLNLEGVGQFGDAKPHALWAGVRPIPPLMRLTAKIEQALQRVGLPPETRRYMPHITLARLRGAAPNRVAAFLAEYALFRAEPFAVEEFVLYSSHLGRSGAHYRVEAVYPLRPDQTLPD
jgi:RNA 2',3'-cyclic 3'-phosphodiesterase